MPRTARSLVLSLLVGSLPLAAQSHPLMADGTAFGGSQVFSMGANPMGSAATLPATGSSIWVGYVDGDLRPKDQADLLDRLASGDPWKASGALAPLKDATWALRTRAYGISMTEDAKSITYSREELNGLWVRPDLDPAHRGSVESLALNTSRVEARRAQVDRLILGGTIPEGDWSTGINVRVERWKFGTQTAALNPVTGEIPLADPKALLAYKEAPDTITTATLDLGVTWQMARGIRAGATAQRLVPRRFQDVEEKVQYRAGLQIDLGSMVALTLESDINAAQRMPLPLEQKSQSASIALHTNSVLSFLVGAERRTLGEVSRTSAGITVQLRMGETLIGAGFQFSDDRPVKGLGWRMAK